ncbi:adenylate isopentenyltransferase 5, chloroplastic-like [Vicia villosa]|uniref:adenylate isopentenyltransferase 5, chloroplastic-like n=1 Tax=Vicia villosa TaxID=3911 RepID=UPI00273AE535|nr:adenylate isopentenyltransferase 5, chloroplastic-like [Vicia villosa]
MASNFSTITEKKNVLFIIGATGTGKTKLSINIGIQFPSEIINSDKIQVYKGLDIVTNKVPESEQCSIPHHLLGIIDDPDYDFTVNDFCKKMVETLDSIIENGHLPIIVGGSNSYLQVLVDDPIYAFRSKYNCCFIWVDVALSILFPYLDMRVNEMVKAGLIDEIRNFFVPEANCTRGIRRAIGVPELQRYFEIENDKGVDEGRKEKILKEAIAEMKENTCKLAENQLIKINNMVNSLGWNMHKIDSTKVFEAVLNGEDYQHLYQEIVIKPSFEIVKRFLEDQLMKTQRNY